MNIARTPCGATIFANNYLVFHGLFAESDNLTVFGKDFCAHQGIDIGAYGNSTSTLQGTTPLSALSPELPLFSLACFLFGSSTLIFSMSIFRAQPEARQNRWQPDAMLFSLNRITQIKLHILYGILEISVNFLSTLKSFSNFGEQRRNP